jgi:hypothetical protein
MRRVWSFFAIGALTVNRIWGLKFSTRLEASLVVTRLPPLSGVRSTVYRPISLVRLLLLLQLHEAPAARFEQGAASVDGPATDPPWRASDRRPRCGHSDRADLRWLRIDHGAVLGLGYRDLRRVPLPRMRYQPVCRALAFASHLVEAEEPGLHTCVALDLTK